MDTPLDGQAHSAILPDRRSVLGGRLAAALFAAAATALAACATPSSAPPAPRTAHHQHLVSPAMAVLWNAPRSFTADDLIAELDDAGIRDAVVLSVAYVYGDERRALPDEAALTRRENDWTAAEVARRTTRLVGFCSANPLKPYAIDELDRCTRLPGMIGIKLHFGNSGVDLHRADHVERVGAVFRFANARRLPVAVHARARTTQPYGRAEAQLFLDRILPLAPDTFVQIAHLAGSGPGYPPDNDAAFAVFADAIAAGDPRTRRLLFDAATTVTDATPPQEAELVARRLRQVGLDRVLFGADLSFGGNPPPREQWRTFLAKVPLSPAEFARIAGNRAPYLR